MSKEIESTTTRDLGIHKAGEVSKYTDDERAQLRALGGLDEASDGDLDMLQAVAQRTGLDPFAKQIYLIGRKTKAASSYRGGKDEWVTKWTVQAGIDGFRAVTHRVAEKKGVPVNIGRPTYYHEDGSQSPIWLKKWGNPAAVEVEVSIGDTSAVGIAAWDEYVQTKRDNSPNSMWEKMGATMLAKCAEAQAHRRVTPLTAGMYTPEEMMQADNRVVMDAKRDTRGMDVVHAALEAKLGNAAPEPEVEPVAIEAAADDADDAELVNALMDGIKTDLLKCQTADDVKALGAQLKNELGDVPDPVKELINAKYYELEEG